MPNPKPDEIDVYVSFTITTEYTWNGTLADLPAKLRTGVFTDGEFDGDKFYEKLSDLDDRDAFLQRLGKKADEADMQVELNEAGQA